MLIKSYIIEELKKYHGDKDMKIYNYYINKLYNKMKRQDFINILVLILIISFIFIVFLSSLKKKSVITKTTTDLPLPVENILRAYNPDNAIHVLYTDEDSDMGDIILVSPGTIAMWYGASIPNGWAICDGTNRTPNLSGRFVKGGYTSNSNSRPITSEKGGNDKIILNIENIPSHKHEAYCTVDYKGNHNHTGQGRTSVDSHKHEYETIQNSPEMDRGYNDDPSAWKSESLSDKSTEKVESHNHIFSYSSSNGDHVHQINVIVQPTGYNIPIENDGPIYFELNFIMKLEERLDRPLEENQINVLHASDNGNIMNTVIIPRGLIVMWNGDGIPYGWALCDGTNNTPNLIDMFVKPTLNTFFRKKGSKYTTLSESNLPSHTHDAKCYLEKDGNHTHEIFNVSLEGEHIHQYKYISQFGEDHGDPGSGYIGNSDLVKGIKESAMENTHTHEFTLTPDGDHYHNVTDYSIDNVGNNKEINMEPPYYVLCYIMKI